MVLLLSGSVANSLVIQVLAFIFVLFFIKRGRKPFSRINHFA